MGGRPAGAVDLKDHERTRIVARYDRWPQLGDVGMELCFWFFLGRGLHTGQGHAFSDRLLIHILVPLAHSRGSSAVASCTAALQETATSRRDAILGTFIEASIESGLRVCTLRLQGFEVGFLRRYAFEANTPKRLRTKTSHCRNVPEGPLTSIPQVMPLMVPGALARPAGSCCRF